MSNVFPIKTQLYSPTGVNGYGNEPPMFQQETASSVLSGANQQLHGFEGGIHTSNELAGEIPDELLDIDFSELLAPTNEPMRNGWFEDVTSPISVSQIRNDSSPFNGQYQKIEELRNSGSEIVKRAIDRIWIELTDSMFDITLRKTFADVIEQIRWDQIDPTYDMGGQNWNLTSRMVTELRNEVNLYISQYKGPYELLYQLKRWHEKLGDPNCHPALVELMLRVLNEERRIIECAQDPRYQNQNNNMLDIKKQEANDYLERIHSLTDKLGKCERISQHAAMEIENLNSSVQELQVLVQGRLRYLDHFNLRELTPAELKTIEGIKQKRNLVWQKEKIVLKNTHWELSNDIQLLITQVLDDEVREWQRNQAYTNNGVLLAHKCTLSVLQDWCKRLARLVSCNMQQITKLQFIEEQIGPDNRPQNSSDATSLQYINELINRYSNMLAILVEKGLVVETQPPQVLMKDKRFQSKLRHLVCDGLDIHQVPFEVEVWLISQEQANNVLKEGTHAKFKEGGTILNNKTRSEYLPNSGILSVSMRNMCLKMGQRGPQRAAEMVAEVKVAMIFRANIAVRCSPTQTITVKAQTISLPIVVISHGKQEADAQATIFWDNAFAKDKRNLFEVEESVHWSRMLDALDCRWKKECRDTNGAVGLTDASKEYLTMKLFKQRHISPNTMISWAKFNHDKMCTGGGAEPRKELFTFWSWFFKAMELCSTAYVRKYWNLGFIHGFLSKQDCHRMLLESGRPGVFLYRFSETKLGALSISCSKVINGQLQVCHLQPDMAKEFKVRSLPDMLLDLEYLHFLYPNESKDEVFGPYYSIAVPPPQSENDGYLPKEFVVVVKNPPGHSSRVSESGISFQSIASPDVSSSLTDKDDGMEDDSS